jgi:hypothetical protein
VTLMGSYVAFSTSTGACKTRWSASDMSYSPIGSRSPAITFYYVFA